MISATQLFAKTVEVEMWTNFNGEKKNQRYEPLIVSIDEGDTVIWKSVEKSHNVEFMTGGVPEGVGEFKSEISQDAEYTFTIPGIYAYICSPHKTGKMLGFVIVGNDKNGNGGNSFNTATYACRPPGVYHGPFKSEKGCTLFELHYYKTDEDF